MDVSVFISVPLIDNIVEKFSLTMVGSLQPDNPDIPQLFKRASVKGSYQFLFAYENNKH